MNTIEHLLTCLAEEGGEVSQAACKALRFGVTDAHEKRGMLPNNEYIVREVNDLLAVLELLQWHGVQLDGIGDRQMIDEKKEKVEFFMSYAEERGVLER